MMWGFILEVFRPKDTRLDQAGVVMMNDSQAWPNGKRTAEGLKDSEGKQKGGNKHRDATQYKHIFLFLKKKS